MTLSLTFVFLSGGEAFIGGAEPVSVSVGLLFRIPWLQAVLRENPMLVAFMTLVAAPLIEEAVFRMMPLTLFEKRSPQFLRMVVVCFGGVFFGALHGIRDHDFSFHILFQGFVGMMLGFLYLKNGPNQLASYFTCVAMHSAYNLTILSIEFAR